MGSLFFHELKKQASFFMKEKIRDARLALTDVTPTELMTEEATNGTPWGPDARTMGFISRAAFEIDDYWRIVEILHKRLSKFDRKNWREPYKALIVLEHLLTHGPGSVAEEFQYDREVIEEMENFQHIDERGFNWGWTVRKKSERILNLLQKGPLLKQERERAREITRGIQGFGSFNQRLATSNDKGDVKQSSDYNWRSNSHYEVYYIAEENQKPGYDAEVSAGINKETETREKSMNGNEIERSSMDEVCSVVKTLPPEESKPPVTHRKQESKIELQEERHPYNNREQQRMESMLLLSRT